MPARSIHAGILRAASGAFGNAATRLASFVVSGGANVYGSYPDIDALFPLQADELDPKKRAAILEKMQRLVHEKAIFAPIWQLAFLNGVGPRVGEVVLRPDRRLPLYGAVRGHHDQEQLADLYGRKATAEFAGNQRDQCLFSVKGGSLRTYGRSPERR